MGEITDSLSVSPGTVVFGVIAAGKAATREVELTATSVEGLRNLQVNSASPMVTARLRPISSTRAILAVTAGSQLPPGTLNTLVTITTSAGENLVLPVLVTVAR